MWWWNRQDDGHRVRVSVETTDHATAVRKVLDYRAKPNLVTAGRWKFEVIGILTIRKRAAGWPRGRSVAQPPLHDPNAFSI